MNTFSIHKKITIHYNNYIIHEAYARNLSISHIKTFETKYFKCISIMSSLWQPIKCVSWDVFFKYLTMEMQLQYLFNILLLAWPPIHKVICVEVIGSCWQCCKIWISQFRLNIFWALNLLSCWNCGNFLFFWLIFVWDFW